MLPPPRAHDDRLPSLAHFVLFNPTLARRSPKPPVNKDAAHSAPDREPRPAPEDAERDRDLEDDLREAAQIVFYTAREAGGVSRDRMLRQVGLAKGLMGFADMVVAGDVADPDAPVHWAIHAQHQRLIVYSPEPDWFIYINIALPRENKDKDAAAKDKDAAPAPPAPSDRMLVEGLRRGYDDFCLLHDSLQSHLPPTPTFTSLLERYWTRFAFAFEDAYLNPGPTSPLQTWLGGWPADLDDAALRETLNALVEGEDNAGAGLVAPKRPLLVAGAVPRGRDSDALARFLLARLVTLPPLPPASKAERHSLSFGFGRRKPAPLKNDLLKVAEGDTRKTSWGLASPLSWVGFAASAPTSRSATPAPAPTPTPTVGPPAGLSKSVDEKGKTEPLATPRPPGAAHKPRWPSLGISFGDAVGNVGAVFGLSSSPKPESRLSQEIGRGSGTTTPAESEASEARRSEESTDEVTKEQQGVEERVPTPAQPEGSEAHDKVQGAEAGKDGGRDKPEASAEEASSTIPEEPKPEEPLQPAAEDAGDKPDAAASEDKGASSGSSPEPASTAEAHPAGISATPLETTPGDTKSPTPVAAAVEMPTEPAPLPTDTLSTPADTPSTSTPPQSVAFSLDDGASILGSQASVADLDAAIHSDVDMAWESRGVYLAGQRRRLFWVIRERTLLYFICPHPDDAHDLQNHQDALPTTTAVLRVFSAYVAHMADEKALQEKKDRPDTTVYHSGEVTEASGSLDTPESGTLAALRSMILGGVSEVLAQTTSGKFAIGKRAEEEGDSKGEGELYALTARRDASLTDAERVVREFAVLRPEFAT